jgi:hypothetical protein
VIRLCTHHLSIGSKEKQENTIATHIAQIMGARSCCQNGQCEGIACITARTLKPSTPPYKPVMNDIFRIQGWAFICLRSFEVDTMAQKAF